MSNKDAPSPPSYFQFTWTFLAEGVQGAITGIPNFTVTHMLFAYDLSLASTDHNKLQTMLNKLRVYAQ